LNWLEDFKKAVIEKDFIKIGEMVNNLPKFETLDENKEALALVKEANYLASQERKKILEDMQNLQKTKKFLQQKDGVFSFDMSF